MPLDPEALYRQLGRLIEEMPDFTVPGPLSKDMHIWLGRADALVREGGKAIDVIDWGSAVRALQDPVLGDGVAQIQLVLYRLLAVAELKAPPGVKGTFIPVASSFDAFASVAKVLKSATRDALVVDPYMDETALTEFGAAIPSGVMLHLLSDKAYHWSTLEPAATKWVAQYGAGRPLQLRLTPPKSLHDRAIFIDQTTAWTLTQSLKDFAKRSPAEIIRADDIADLKIPAYETIWAGAQIVV